MATAERAVAMPAVLLVLALALSALTAAVDQIRCVDAARVAVRLMARGEGEGAALAAGRAVAPKQAVLTVETGPTEVRVSVTAPAPWALRWLGADGRPSGSAVAAREDTWPEAVP
jgi:predicted S18 family serine protease